MEFPFKVPDRFSLLVRVVGTHRCQGRIDPIVIPFQKRSLFVSLAETLPSVFNPAPRAPTRRRTWLACRRPRLPRGARARSDRSRHKGPDAPTRYLAQQTVAGIMP